MSKSNDRDAQVVPLGTEPPPPPPPSRPTRGHGWAIAGMAFFALAGIAAMFLFVTVRWPDETGRYVIAVAFGCGIGFLACATAAVFTAARATYNGGSSGD